MSDFNQVRILLKIFEKFSNSKFNENPSNGSRVVPCGRTDRYDEANNSYSQFYERAQKIDNMGEFRLPPQSR
jgi:hypothetical protein